MGRAAYTTTEEVKIHINITGTTWDNFIHNLITPLSERADQLTDRTKATLGQGFNTHTLTSLYYLTTGRKGIQLEEWPVQSVVSITDDGVALAATDYQLFGREGFVQFVDSAGLPVYRYGKIETTVVAGYDIVPHTIRIAMARQISYLMQRADEEGIGAELVGQIQTTWRPLIGRYTNELDDIFYQLAGDQVLDVGTVLTGEIA
jgi:hypothetical protein